MRTRRGTAAKRTAPPLSSSGDARTGRSGRVDRRGGLAQPLDARTGAERAFVLREFIEELQAIGYEFREGRGVLVAVLGTMTD